MARAVYSKAPVLILDDVFSGLDTRTAAAISSRLLSKDGHLRQSGRSAILTTNNYHFLSLADTITVLENGRISWTGTYDGMDPVLLPELDNDWSEDSSHGKILDLQAAEHKLLNIPPASLDQDLSPEASMRKEKRLDIYLYYFRTAGWAVTILLALSVTFAGFANRFSSSPRLP